MQKKKKQILEAAVSLFARQGFHATSIQEIVDEVGMAKGSIYFYFKSKDDLLVSIFEYYGEQMDNGMAQHPGEEGLSSRELLRLQLERQFLFLKENAEFLQMLMKEPLAGVHQEEIKKIVFRFRSKYLNWLYGSIKAIYGVEAERYWADGVLVLGGMMNQFMEGVLIDREAIDSARVSRFLVRRLDDVMQGMISDGEQPIMGHSGIRRLMAFGVDQPEKGHAAGALKEIKDLAKGTDAEETVALIEAELNKPLPHRVYIRALLALLEKQAEPNWRQPLGELAQALEKRLSEGGS